MFIGLEVQEVGLPVHFSNLNASFRSPFCKNRVRSDLKSRQGFLLSLVKALAKAFVFASYVPAVSGIARVRASQPAPQPVRGCPRQMQL